VSEGVACSREPRKWKTAIRSASVAEAQSDERGFEANEDRRARRMAVTFERHRQRVVAFFKENQQEASARSIRDKLGINGPYAVRVLESLVKDGRLVASELKKQKRTEVMYALPGLRMPDSLGSRPD